MHNRNNKCAVFGNSKTRIIKMISIKHAQCSTVFCTTQSERKKL
jgi:hypothetical protein